MLVLGQLQPFVFGIVVWHLENSTSCPYNALMTITKLRTAALALAPMDREALAEDLLHSITQEDQEAIDAAWLREVRRREARLAAGKSRTRPVDQVLGRLRRKAQS
jgi:putative addiction module component (TIGR02574 family)